MQNLIATTFEVVHYIALQAVHYKPLQEVHLSRYNQGIENHVQDMQDVFPFAECLNIFYLVSSYLDEPDWAVAGAQRPHFIKEDPFFSKEKFDNHRIWYHWGLSELGMLSPSLARTHRPLV